MRKYLSKLKVPAFLMCIIAVATLILTGCNEDDFSFINVNTGALELTSAAHKEVIEIKTNTAWSVSSDATWCRIIRGTGSLAGSFDVVIDENPYILTRSAIVTVSGKDCSTTVVVRQAGSGANLSISQENVEFYKDAETQKISVFSNHEWYVSSSNSWCTVSRSAGVGNDDFTISVSANNTGNSRSALIVVSTESNGQTFMRSINVSQTTVASSISVSPNEKVLASEAEDFNITVLSSASWNASVDSGWLSIDKTAGVGDDVIKVSASVNNTNGERKGVITIYAEGEGGVRVARIVTVTQGSGKYYLEIPITEYLMPKEAGQVDVKYLLAGHNCTIEATSNATWATPVVQNGSIRVTVTANTSAEVRAATISVNTVGQSGAPTIKTITITQSASNNFLELLIDNITLNSMGETANVRVSTNTGFETHTTSTWISVVKTGNDITISANMNTTGETRIGYITVSMSGTGEQNSKIIKVTQLHADVQFKFEPAMHTFDYNQGSQSIVLNSTIGNWAIETPTQNIPTWISVSSTSGIGSTPINITVTRNTYVRNRNFDLIFKNALTGQTAILSIQQSKDPAIVLADYKYLGMGYDVAGEYAVDRYVRAQIFDWSKLEEKGYLAGVTSHNMTEESYIYGQTITEYQNSMSANASVSGNYAGFSASVKASYSQSSYSSAENEFATFRHITQKQSVHLHTNVTAAELMECLTNEFKADIATMTTDNLFRKYGTHVIGGFVMGGSLDYSMTADRSSMSSSVDWGIAVEAGYNSAAAGINVGVEYNQYNATKTQAANFEERLLVRGGQSQNASSFGSQAAHDQWLSSLSDPSTWVLVDYYGPKLFDIWDFAGSRRAEIEAAARAWCARDPFNPTSTHKTLAIEVTLMYILMDDNPAAPTDTSSEIAFQMFITPPTSAETLFINYPLTTGLHDDGASNSIYYKSPNYTFSTLKTQVLKLRVEGYEDDSSGDDYFYSTAQLTYNPISTKWEGNLVDRNGSTWVARSVALGNNDIFYVMCTENNNGTGDQRVVFQCKLLWN